MIGILFLPFQFAGAWIFAGEWIYHVAKYIIKPDLAFFLDVSVETALKRVRVREIEKEKYIDITLQYQLRKYYRDIAEKNEGILLSITESEKRTYNKIVTAIGRKGRNPLILIKRK